MRLTIGELSRRTGVNIETVRYYERAGVLPKPPRTGGGHRVYDEGLLKRLTFVRRARELGFSLDEIRALLSLVDGGDFTCAEVYGLTAKHLEAVRRRIAGLRRMERGLKAMAAECDRGEVPECPIVDTLFRPNGKGTDSNG